ncbi:MAG: hypothetical protein ACO1N3_05185 [Gammaproteobacteria bacterium]
MPSQALADISVLIERQDTDAFGKFYMYASLLNALTVRQKSFLETLPKYTPNSGFGLLKTVGATIGVNDTPELKTGIIDGNFSRMVDEYKTEFDVRSPNFVLVIQRILLSFVRKGQLSDLIFIIKKMNDHLQSQPMATPNHNGFIFGAVAFEERKLGVKNLLKTAEVVMNLAQKSVDHSMYGFITVIAACIAVKITLSLGGLFLTFGMLAASGYLAYLFFQSAITAFEQIEQAAENCMRVGEIMFAEQAVNIMQPNNFSFIIKSILAPIAYTGTTVREQLAPTESLLREAKRSRLDLDALYQSESTFKF